MASSPLPARRRAPRMTARLRAIVEQVPHGSGTLADIGTDHGFVPIRALLTGRAERALACELRLKPLDEARRTAAHECPDRAIEFRLGDGLDVLEPGEADVVTIAGIGDANVRDILERGHDRLQGVSRLVLNPFGEAFRVRTWLRDHGFELIDEVEVSEASFHYMILVATPGDGNAPYASSAFDDDVLLRVGPKLVEDPSAFMVLHFESRLRAAREVERQLEGHDGLDDRRQEWAAELDLLERVLAAIR